MNRQNVQLIDSNNALIATADVSDECGLYMGMIDLTAAPATVRAVFDEFEEYVNEQFFSLLDEIQDKVAALGIRARFANGREEIVVDLQVFPRAGETSFRLAECPKPTVVAARLSETAVQN